MKNQRWILLVLIGGLLLPLFSYASDKPQIIESSYLNNNYVYWNSDWSTSYKNEKHQINLDKALSLFEKIRENINCKETDHNVYEKYFCVLVMTNQFHNYDTRQESKSLGEQYMGLMQDKPLTFMASLMTVSSILVGDIALRFNYTNALENYFIHYYYLTPYDRAILSDKNKLFAYMKALFQKEGTPYSMGDQLTVDGYAFKRSASLENFINNLGQRQTIFDKGQKGFQFGILNGGKWPPH
jgi:hypothetical protein